MSMFIDLYVNQGEDYEVILDINDTDDIVNLENSVFFGQIRKTPFSSVYYNINVSNLEFDNTKLILSIPASTSNSIRPGKYMYDVFIKESPIFGSDKIIKLMEGGIVINPRITRVEMYE
jgi:hypothetical protein